MSGTLRGYDQFMNIVLGDAVEETVGSENNRIGMVVIRGNSIVQVITLVNLNFLFHDSNLFVLIYFLLIFFLNFVQ